MFLRFNKQSIFLRLTTLYALLAFLLIVISSVMLYSVLVDNIQQRDRGFVAGEISTLVNILKSPSYEQMLVALNQEAVLEPRTSLDHYFVRVYRDHKPLVETPEYSHVIKAMGDNLIVESKIFRWAGATYTIDVALDITSSQALIQVYQRNLFIVVFLSIFISAFLGYIITAAGIRPLKKMNKSLCRIEVDDLDRRLNIRDLPKELRDMGLAINDLLERIENSFQRLTQFSSDLAHELRTPLNAMITQSEIILSKPRDKDEYAAALESNFNECQKLSRLIDQILFIARAKSPQNVLDKSSVDVHEVMSSMIEYFDIIAREKDIDIVLEGEGRIVVDRELFKRAIANVLANAITYTPEGGRISIHVSQSEHDVAITIQDTGIGIAEHHIPNLFDRFYRVSDSRSRNDGGSGLGLAIVKSIMMLHQGSVGVESAPNKGTIFNLVFPV